MGIIHETRSMIKHVIFSLKNAFKFKVPVKIPVYEAELLNGRKAIITGGASGIGYSIAESFLKNKCSVLITGRNINKLEEAVRKLKKISANVSYLQIDITDTKTFSTKMKEATKLLGENIDILVNNAGIMEGENFPNTKLDAFERVIDTNLKGMYFFSQEFANYMIKNKIKGNILNISSTSENRPVVNPYSLSKWGVKGFTIGMAKKLIDYDIIVNAIAPGPTKTEMLSDNKNEDISKSQYPMSRYIMPEEIANIAVFLTSEMGKNITGQTIFVSNGIGITTIDDIDY